MAAKFISILLLFLSRCEYEVGSSGIPGRDCAFFDKLVLTVPKKGYANHTFVYFLSVVSFAFSFLLV